MRESRSGIRLRESVAAKRDRLRSVGPLSPEALRSQDYS